MLASCAAGQLGRSHRRGRRSTQICCSACLKAVALPSAAGDEGGRRHLHHVQGLLHDGLELPRRHDGRRQAHADHPRPRETVQGAQHRRRRTGTRGPRPPRKILGGQVQGVSHCTTGGKCWTTVTLGTSFHLIDPSQFQGSNIRSVVGRAELTGRPRHGHRRLVGRALQQRREGPVDRGNVPQAELGVQVSANQCCPKEAPTVHARTHRKQVPRPEQEAGGDGEGRSRTRDVLGAEEQETGLGRRHFRSRSWPKSENLRDAKQAT